MLSTIAVPAPVPSDFHSSMLLVAALSLAAK
jgi:hypothetical protein